MDNFTERTWIMVAFDESIKGLRKLKTMKTMKKMLAVIGFGLIFLFAPRESACEIA
jgi:hypothetical protein